MGMTSLQRLSWVLGLAGFCLAAGCSSPSMSFVDTDTGSDLDAGGDLDTGGSETGVTCGEVVCGPGQACCEATGRCYNPACLSCCMPPSDGGTVTDSGPDAGSTDATPTACG